jgi:hypothetical protein
MAAKSTERAAAARAAKTIDGAAAVTAAKTTDRTAVAGSAEAFEDRTASALTAETSGAVACTGPTAAAKSSSELPVVIPLTISEPGENSDCDTTDSCDGLISSAIDSVGTAETLISSQIMSTRRGSSRTGHEAQLLSWRCRDPAYAAKVSGEDISKSSSEDESSEENMLEREMLEGNDELLPRDMLKDTEEHRGLIHTLLGEHRHVREQEQEVGNGEQVPDIMEQSAIRWIEDVSDQQVAATRPEPETDAASAWPTDSGKKCSSVFFFTIGRQGARNFTFSCYL